MRPFGPGFLSRILSGFTIRSVSNSFKQQTRMRQFQRFKQKSEKKKKRIWVFPKIGGTPQNGWFIMEILIKMDDLGGFPIFLVQHPYLPGVNGPLVVNVTFHPSKPYKSARDTSSYNSEPGPILS